ncbi:MAG TPA: hypothetical protein DC054_07880 [Blastocatellia bacterium]|nr:hypothetical protein [Blastocatellia bacterium]
MITEAIPERCENIAAQFRGDFRECDRFVQYMLRRKLYEKTSGQLNLIRSAFETALVISYCRPFGNNKNMSGDGHSSLTHAIDNVLLDEGERELHFLIKERRNRLCAIRRQVRMWYRDSTTRTALFT